MAERKSALAGPHLVRYGIAGDQKYLVGDLLDTYDELVVNARMVAHMATGLALFLTHRAHNKPYFIDPETHIFQHDPDYLQSTSEQNESRLKRSVGYLIEWYGDPVERVVKKEQSILPEDFGNDAERSEFCRRVIEFQLKAISERVQDTENAEYYEFLKEKGVVESSSFTPTLVVAPYFCMDGNTFEDWIDANIGCARDSRVIAKERGVPLAVEIVITQSVLFDRKLVESLVGEYKILKPDVFLVWVDAFSEQEVPGSLLSAFSDMLKGLKETGSEVVNLYGGYFSIMLLQHDILDGVTHGLEYGEERPLVPVGGGIPTAKFYLPALHLRLKHRDALRAVKALRGFESVESFHSNVCDCLQCKKTIACDAEKEFGNYLKTKRVNNRDIPYPETKDNSVRHYMLCKQKEFKSGGSDAELNLLKHTGSDLRRFVGPESTDHCAKWADVISSLSR